MLVSWILHCPGFCFGRAEAIHPWSVSSCLYIKTSSSVRVCAHRPSVSMDVKEAKAWTRKALTSLHDAVIRVVQQPLLDAIRAGSMAFDPDTVLNAFEVYVTDWHTLKNDGRYTLLQKEAKGFPASVQSLIGQLDALLGTKETIAEAVFALDLSLLVIMTSTLAETQDRSLERVRRATQFLDAFRKPLRWLTQSSEPLLAKDRNPYLPWNLVPLVQRRISDVLSDVIAATLKLHAEVAARQRRTVASRENWKNDYRVTLEWPAMKQSKNYFVYNNHAVSVEEWEQRLTELQGFAAFLFEIRREVLPANGGALMREIAASTGGLLETLAKQSPSDSMAGNWRTLMANLSGALQSDEADVAAYNMRREALLLEVQSIRNKELTSPDTVAWPNVQARMALFWDEYRNFSGVDDDKKRFLEDRAPKTIGNPLQTEIFVPDGSTTTVWAVLDELWDFAFETRVAYATVANLPPPVSQPRSSSSSSSSSMPPGTPKTKKIKKPVLHSPQKSPGKASLSPPAPAAAPTPHDMLKKLTRRLTKSHLDPVNAAIRLADPAFANSFQALVDDLKTGPVRQAWDAIDPATIPPGEADTLQLHTEAQRLMDVGNFESAITFWCIEMLCLQVGHPIGNDQHWRSIKTYIDNARLQNTFLPAWLRDTTSNPYLQKSAVDGFTDTVRSLVDDLVEDNKAYSDQLDAVRVALDAKRQKLQQARMTVSWPGPQKDEQTEVILFTADDVDVTQVDELESWIATVQGGGQVNLTRWRDRAAYVVQTLTALPTGGNAFPAAIVAALNDYLEAMRKLSDHEASYDKEVKARGDVIADMNKIQALYDALPLDDSVVLALIDIMMKNTPSALPTDKDFRTRTLSEIEAARVNTIGPHAMVAIQCTDDAASDRVRAGFDTLVVFLRNLLLQVDAIVAAATQQPPAQQPPVVVQPQQPSPASAPKKKDKGKNKQPQPPAPATRPPSPPPTIVHVPNPSQSSNTLPPAQPQQPPVVVVVVQPQQPQTQPQVVVQPPQQPQQPQVQPLQPQPSQPQVVVQPQQPQPNVQPQVIVQPQQPSPVVIVQPPQPRIVVQPQPRQPPAVVVIRPRLPPRPQPQRQQQQAQNLGRPVTVVDPTYEEMAHDAQAIERRFFDHVPAIRPWYEDEGEPGVRPPWIESGNDELPGAALSRMKWPIKVFNRTTHEWEDGERWPTARDVSLRVTIFTPAYRDEVRQLAAVRQEAIAYATDQRRRERQQLRERFADAKRGGNPQPIFIAKQ